MFHPHHDLGLGPGPDVSVPDLTHCFDPADHAGFVPADPPPGHDPRFGDGGSYEGNGVWRDEGGHLHEGNAFGPNGGWDLISM